MMTQFLPLQRSHSTIAPTPFRIFTRQHIDRIPGICDLSEERKFDIQVVSRVLPFRVNRYVLEELIDWQRVPDDPVFRMVIPHREMLESTHFNQIAALLRAGASEDDVATVVEQIRSRLNPHPARQETMNIPSLDGQPLQGMQHKYRETVLFFPHKGQSCHSTCTFCFRWAQFTGNRQRRFASNRLYELFAWLRQHREVTDLLITGGDPMVMSSSNLADIIRPLLHPDFRHLHQIRIGTKAITFWPYRFTEGREAAELIRLFQQVVREGKHLALMAHFSHPQEIRTTVARRAIRCILDSGAVIRSQGALLKHINDDPAIWTELWSRQVQLGMVPYYMFVERDTGARHYFQLPLARTWKIYQQAVQQVSGLGRTVRGPVMSAAPGKVEILGVSEIRNEKVFVLRFLQGRNPDWVGRPFYARYDRRASWLSQLKPAFDDEFFFEPEFQRMMGAAG